MACCFSCHHYSKGAVLAILFRIKLITVRAMQTFRLVRQEHKSTGATRARVPYALEREGRRSIHVSLSSIAVAVLVRQLGKRPERVFTYNGKPIAWANTVAWRQALKRAGIEDFR